MVQQKKEIIENKMCVLINLKNVTSLGTKCWYKWYKMPLKQRVTVEFTEYSNILTYVKDVHIFTGLFLYAQALSDFIQFISKFCKISIWWDVITMIRHPEHLKMHETQNIGTSYWKYAHSFIMCTLKELFLRPSHDSPKYLD